ncbi:MAG TPA: hypothetical protein EYP65_08095, partial [Armatimonadetes bacterium]|nr:hypothetical protein [Armatimonadota bacterium]
MAYYYRRRPPRRMTGCGVILSIVAVLLGLWLGVREALSPLLPRRAWRLKTGEAFCSPPLVSGGVVLAGTAEGTLYILRARSGEVVAKGSALLGSFVRPLLAEGLAIFASDDFRVYALRARTGQIKWRAEMGGSVRAPLALSGRAVIAGADSGRVCALLLPEGREVWSASVGGVVRALCADARRCYVAVRLGRVLALDVRDGKRLW